MDAECIEKNMVKKHLSGLFGEFNCRGQASWHGSSNDIPCSGVTRISFYASERNLF